MAGIGFKKLTNQVFYFWLFATKEMIFEKAVRFAVAAPIV